MKKVFHLVLDYVKTTFNLKLYSSILLLIIILVGFNYSPLFETTYEKDVIRAYHGTPWEMVWFFFTMYVPYLVTCLLITIFTERKDIFKKRNFWLISIFIFILIAVSRGAWLEQYAEYFRTSWYRYVYYFKIFDDIESVFLIAMPLVLFYIFWDKKRIGHFYGIQTKGADVKPYVIMLGIMSVPIFLASLTDGFQVAYPKALQSEYINFALYDNHSEVSLLVLFEVVYLFSFIAVELVYRGALIYSIEKFLGDYVVLPMVVCYAVLHFGKPLGETIGSVGGGYILGILALRTKNIYGGIFIHMGVAFLMEVFAFLAR